MSIQALASPYPGTAGIAALRTTAAATFSSLARQTIASNATNQDDAVVNISPEARRLGETGLPGWVHEEIEKLRANPDQSSAMQSVEWMATLSRGPLVSLAPDSDGIRGVYYAYTGEAATPESLRRYAGIEQASIAETARIFQDGKARGSSAAEIFEQMQRHMATLPDDYLRTLDWFRPSLAHAT